MIWIAQQVNCHYGDNRHLDGKMQKINYIVSIVIVVILFVSVSFFFVPTIQANADKPPDTIFLIIIETLRADRLSCYGYDQHLTPNIDYLAREGTMFLNAQSVASWTRPSVGAIMTSSYPTQLGMVEKEISSVKKYDWRERRKQKSFSMPIHKTTLSDLTKTGGYRNVAFVNQPALSPLKAFRKNFDDFYCPSSSGKIINLKRAPSSVVQDWQSSSDAYENDLALTTKVDQWLNDHHGEKSFVWIHLMTPHRPYLPPPAYDPSPSFVDDYDKQTTESLMYDGEVLAADEIIGNITKIIRNRIGFNQSFIVLTSDHGEEFWDHNMYEHGHSLHREVIHVPLILVSPLLPKGMQISRYVRTIDIFPTILNLAQIDIPSKTKIEGYDLTGFIKDKSIKLPVYSEAMLYGSTERSFIENGYKLMYEYPDTWRLYEINSDKNETLNISEKSKKKTLKMRKKLIKLHNRLERDHQSDSKGSSYKPDKSEEQQALESLKILGYIE